MAETTKLPVIWSRLPLGSQMGFQWLSVVAAWAAAKTHLKFALGSNSDSVLEGDAAIAAGMDYLV